MNISNIAIFLDKTCDYIPIISTCSNLFVLFQKSVFNCCSTETIEGNAYWTHVRDKDLYYSILLLVPVAGNIIYFCILCCSSDGDAEVVEEPEREVNQSLARFLQKLPGNENLQMEDVGPAPHLDQQILVAACYERDIEVVERQLKKGVNPNFFDNGRTPLTAALHRGAAEIVRLLLDYDADCNLVDQFQSHPFVESGFTADVNIIKMIFEKGGMDVNTAGSMGHTALIGASSHGSHAVKFLLDCKADPTMKAFDHRDACLGAIYQWNIEIVKLLFPEGSNYADTIKYHLWIDKDHSLHDGTELGEHCLRNMTPLQYAFFVDAPTQLKAHLIRQSNLELRDSEGRNAVHYLAEFGLGNPQLLDEMLVKLKDDPIARQRVLNCSDNQHRTPLHRLSEKNDHKHALTFWVHRGVNPEIGEFGTLDTFYGTVERIEIFIKPLWTIIYQYANAGTVHQYAQDKGLRATLAVINGTPLTQVEEEEIIKKGARLGSLMPADPVRSNLIGNANNPLTRLMKQYSAIDQELLAKARTLMFHHRITAKYSYTQPT